VASEKGTVHIFNLDATGNQPAGIPSVLKAVLPKYFSCARSFAQLHLREGRVCVAFLPDQQNALAVVRYDGLYFKYVFDEERGGEAVMVNSKAL
jgi:hypothetical protein